MKMVRLTERCLGALGASPDFTEDVLGDLAEEFALRATYDGVATARRWYYREALRVVPYLLRDALRHVSGRELLALGKTILITWFAVEVCGRVFFAAREAVLSALGLPEVFLLSAVWLAAPLFVLINGIRPMVGGYVAAAVYKKAPLLGAAAVALIWLGFDVVAIARFGASFPALYRYGAPFILIAFLTAGALLRVSRAPRVSIE